MTRAQADSFGSIRTAIFTKSKSALKRLALALFGLLFCLSAGLAFYHFSSRPELVAEGMQNNLAHLIAVGDHFQIQRQIGSLVESSHFAGIWVYDSMHQSIIAHAASEKTLPAAPSPSQGPSLSLRGGHLEVLRSFRVNLAPDRQVGTIIFAMRLPIFAIALVAGAVLAIFGLINWLLLRSIKKVAKEVSDPVVAFSDFMSEVDPEVGLSTKSFPNPRFREVANAHAVFEQLWTKLREFQKLEQTAIKSEVLGKLARQVAHDIRSPLTALNAVLEDSRELPEERREIARTAIHRIQDIASNLLERNDPPIVDKETPRPALPPENSRTTTRSLIPALVDELLREKRYQYSGARGVDLAFSINENNYAIFSLIQPSEFKRALSNLINNAVESLLGPGRVELTLDATDSTVTISVKDGGSGIPADILAKLRERGFSYAKAGGSGLGLEHARRTVESWGGSLLIESELGKGTRVTLRLPRVAAPEWLATNLPLKPTSRLIVVDDDPLIHWVWDNRFPKRTPQHFSSPELAELHCRRDQPREDDVFLIDFQYNNSGLDGLDLIGRLGIYPQSILVTGAYDDERVQSRSESLGVKILPKSMAPYVPLASGDAFITTVGGSSA